MLVLGGMARAAVAADMDGDAIATMEQLDAVGGDAGLQFLPDQGVGRRVIEPMHLNVIVDVDGVDGRYPPASRCHRVAASNRHIRGAVHMSIVTIGLDLAKHVFQVHGVDESGRVVMRKQLRRAAVEEFFAAQPPCLVGMEACATAHHWARRVAALGHQVRLIPPTRVKAYVQRGKKNDATDAAAIAEAVTRPHMAFVPVKSEDQQAVLMLHRTRDLLVRQRTMVINALRAHLAEFGIIAAQGRQKVGELMAGMAVAAVPDLARSALQELAGQIENCDQRILALEKEIFSWHKTNEQSSNLATIPGIGPITASLLAATVTDPSAFKNGRQMAAWLGLVPRQNSSGGKDRLGKITKTGDRSIRRLLVIGATSVIRYARTKAPGDAEWLKALLGRKPTRVVTVALANKMARIAWAVLTRGEVYRKTPPMPATA